MHTLMAKYLAPSPYIDFDHDLVAKKAFELASGHHSDTLIAQYCYEFVRDSIKHSWDYRQNPVTCKASDVLLHGTGYCFAKSHLLAALLRANNIPTGLCYQRLTIEKEGALYSLHGLNAVYLNEFGWYRIDPRGNKPGVEAQFCPPTEKLAFQILGPNEGDFLEIWPEPLPLVVEVLTAYKTVEQVYQHLPDIEILKRKIG
jgi:transglutaminase-like putative cysteine protease